MPTNKTINLTNTVHRIDDQGAIQGWGERYHDLQVDVVDALNSVSGSSDISEQTYNLSVSTTEDITGMSFDLTAFSAGSAFFGTVDYAIKRVHDGTSYSEAGFFRCTYDGTNFDFVQESLGDEVGVAMTFDNNGQASYTSTNPSPFDTGSTTTFLVRFKARSVSNL
jgi:hypothetical protein